MEAIEILELNKEYGFDVQVQDGENRFAGRLELSPDRVILTINGEETEGRGCSFSFSDIDEVWCYGFNNTFILKNLMLLRGQSGVLERINGIGFFVYVYEVEYLAHFTSTVSQELKFSGFSVDFEETKSWIGHTNTQEKILKRYEENKLSNDSDFDPTQFRVPLHGVGHIILEYNVSAHYSASDFSSGVHFPPSLDLRLSEDRPLEELKELYDRFYNLMSFIIGSDISVSSLEIANTNMYSTMKASLYYAHTKYCRQRKNRYPLYPLGRDLRFDTFGYPEFDISAFNRFFSLDKDNSSKWKKYRKYRDIVSVEERFLGYFRLLESLVYKSKNYLDEEILVSLTDKFKSCLIKRFDDKRSVNSFLRGLPRYNASKYNTAKCIGDFYKSLPAEIRDKWIFSNSEINGICKLRNDITHANDYHETDNSLYKKSVFIETLLVFALFEKLGIPSEKVAPIIHRLDGHDHIMNRG